MSEALAVVPPMSKDTARFNPMAATLSRAASTPAAGPDSTMVTGCRAAKASGLKPPLHCMMKTGETTPFFLRRPSSPSR